MNSFLDGESLAVRTPLDEDAMIVVDIAPETLVLLSSEVLRVPDQDSSILSAAGQVFTIGTQVQVFIISYYKLTREQRFYRELGHCGPSV